MITNQFDTNDINRNILSLWYTFLCSKKWQYPDNIICKKCKTLIKEHKIKQASKSIRMPVLFPNIYKEKFLCVGLNPSHNEQFFHKHNISKSIFEPSCFAFSPHSHISKRIIEIYNFGLNNYKSYYNKLKELSEKVDLEMIHIDLFMFRETCSKCFYKFNKEYNDFAESQLYISKELILKVSPIFILVANAKASKIFEEKFFKNECLYFPNRGYHITKINGQFVPTFLSAQLSGGTTDNYSYQRLAYLMEKAKNDIKDLNKITELTMVFSRPQAERFSK